MIKLPVYTFLSGFLLLILSLPLPLSAAQKSAAPPSKQDGKVTLDFHDIELSELIQTISELTGKNFIYDETVRGKATIVSPDSMTIDEAYQLFISVLNVKGFTIVPSGKVNKVLPIKLAKGKNLPTVVNDEIQNSEQFITRLVRLQYLDAGTIATTVLAPLLPAEGSLVAYPPSNTLIITDSAANIERMMSIIRELDQPDSNGMLEIIQLQDADAEEMAKICNEILTDAGNPQSKTLRRANGPSVSQAFASKVMAYKRTNSLILMANAEDLLLIKELVARMDKASDGKRANINLYYLENADAVSLAATLNEILTGIKAQPRKDSQDNKSPLSNAPVSITADKPTNALIVNANPDDYDVLKEIIRQLDIKRKQVYVEALILELSMDATQRLGASLQGGASVDGNGLTFGTSNLNTGPAGIGDTVPGSDTGLPGLLTKAIDGLLVGGFFNPISVIGPNGDQITVPALSALIDIARTTSDINILSAPRLLTSDNEEAEIIVGSNVPIITGRLTDAGGSNGLAQSVSVERQDVALILRFTPQVTEGEQVRLNVYQELTDIAPASAGLTASVGSPSEVGPTFTKRVLRNTVLAENGKTVVLGGLIDTNVTETISKVPLLGDIPVLGWLFKRKSTQEKKTNLLVFINPTIIKNSGDLSRVTDRNRTSAKALLSEKVIEALPQEYFGEQPDDQSTGRRSAAEAAQ